MVESSEDSFVLFSIKCRGCNWVAERASNCSDDLIEEALANNSAHQYHIRNTESCQVHYMYAADEEVSVRPRRRQQLSQMWWMCDLNCRQACNSVQCNVPCGCGWRWSQCLIQWYGYAYDFVKIHLLHNSAINWVDDYSDVVRCCCWKRGSLIISCKWIILLVAVACLWTSGLSAMVHAPPNRCVLFIT